MRNQIILTPLTATVLIHALWLAGSVPVCAAAQPVASQTASAQVAQAPAPAQIPASAQPLSSAPADVPAAPNNEVIVAMREAFQRGDQTRLTALLPLTRGNPLEPWAAYWELKARLESATPAEVQAFLARWAGTYQEDRLRNDWLLLAGKRRNWVSFAAEYPNFRMRDDPQVACYAAAMSALQGAPADPDAAALVRKNWFAQRELDDGCLLAANVLHQTRQITDIDLWRRARVALETGRPALARAAAALAAPQADVDVAQIQNGALRYLHSRSLAQWQPALRQQLATLALVRLAAQDSDQAAAQMDHWVGTLPQEARNWVWGAIGKEAAIRLSDTALGYYAHVTQPADLSDGMLAWQARAALRQGQWKTVRTAITALHAAAAQKPVWVYWLARARIQLAKSDADRQTARQDLASIAGGGGFYQKLAQEYLGGVTTVPPAPPPLTMPETNAARRNPGLVRALLMISLGLRPEGTREWNYWINLHQNGGMGDRELYAAADLACQYQVWDRCINTSERTRGFVDYGQRFPMPYRDAVLAAANQAALDPAYVYGLVRQESRFVTMARSGAGASGLMQLMPATARWTARKIGLTNYSHGQLQDQATNLLLGTSYLKLILNDFQGSLPLAAAAYNAGPRRLRAWRLGPTLEGAIWIENIPFNETRDYVQNVLANTTDYAAVLTGQPQTLKSRLGQIGPSGDANDSSTELP